MYYKMILKKSQRYKKLKYILFLVPSLVFEAVLILYMSLPVSDSTLQDVKYDQNRRDYCTLDIAIMQHNEPHYGGLVGYFCVNGSPV